MTREETKRLLTEIAQLFPRFVNQDEDKKLKVDLWAEALGEYEYARMHEALMAYVRTESKGYAPTAGQLIDLATDWLSGGKDHEFWTD